MESRLTREDAEAKHELADSLRRTGRFAEALELYRFLLSGNPQDARAHAGFVHSLRASGQVRDAAVAGERAVTAAPSYAPAWFHFGAALALCGRSDEALAAYERCIGMDARYAEAWSNLGALLGARGDVKGEIEAYRRAIEARPDLAPIWINIASALYASGELVEAERSCRRALELEPRAAGAWVNLGNVLKDRGRRPEALQAFAEAIECEPGLPEAWLGQGIVQHENGDHASAVASLQRSCLLNPKLVEAHVNLGRVLSYLGEQGSAIESFRRALAIDRDHAEASWSLSLLLLAAGRLEEGWRLYESRWRRRSAASPRFPLPRAAPRFERGESVLVWGEQGVGDELLHAPLARELTALGVHVTLECDPRLVTLLKRSLGRVAVVPRTDPPSVQAGAFDHAVPAASLGSVRRPSFEHFPADGSWLKPDPARTDAIATCLKRSGHRRTVGISWRSRNPDIGKTKSVPLELWRPVLQMTDFDFVSLQYGTTDAELAQIESILPGRVSALEGLDLTNDLEDLAALAANCDLVLTVSNVTAHFAGALGRPTWVMVPAGRSRHWYWFAGRRDNPWYPSMRLFAQTRVDEWPPVIEDVRAALASWGVAHNRIQP